MSSTASAETWGLHAAACELLALSLRYPTEELAEVVASGEWGEAAEEIAAALALEVPAGFAAESRRLEGSLEPLHALRAEATRLFVGAPKPVCSPYEGVWRAEDDRVQALLFVNPHSLAVERFCRACSLGQPEGTNEPLDHVATELELLQYLASLAAGIAASVASSPANEGLPGGGAAEAYGAFMKEHVLAWAPRFAAKLQEEASSSFYRAVGAMLAAFLKAAA